VNNESIYPELFKSGLQNLQQTGAWDGNLFGLFSGLDQFRREINDRRDVKSLLEVTGQYALSLGVFEAVGFLLINPADFNFELTHCAPEDRTAYVDGLVRKEIRSGGFAWALRQNAPAFFRCPGEGEACGVFHTLGLATRRLGMFCGILRGERAPSQEVAFGLLSIILGACSDALADVRITEELQNKILAASEGLQRALIENEVLARISEESPNPVMRVSRRGQVLYSNQPGLAILRTLGWQVGDLISGEWMGLLQNCFARGTRHDFEAVVQGRAYALLIVPVSDADYANFYGTEITARKVAEAERERLIHELQDALSKVKTLSGLVPICAWCKKIRDDGGFWKEVEVFVQTHSEATFSHGVCPECRKTWLADRARQKLAETDTGI
jgi:hypothetical protein